MTQNMRGKVCLVTGGSSGIGKNAYFTYELARRVWALGEQLAAGR